MLLFGLPHIAYYAALELNRIDEGNGLAWAVTGYMQAKKGELAEALASTLRAAEKLPQDPSVLHNAGQLAAWHDQDPQAPRIPDVVRRALANLKDELAKKEPFAKAYEAIRGAYQDGARAAGEVDKKIAAAETEVQAVQQLAGEIDRHIRDLNDEIDYRNRTIDSLYRDMRYSYGAYARDSEGRLIYLPRYGYWRDDLRLRIRDEEREIEKLRNQLRQVAREGEAVLAELTRKQTVVEQLRRQVRAVQEKLERAYRWDPPAVDGVVTPERDRLPPATGADLRVPADPEAEAAQRLELARLYLRHDMGQKAVELLQEIIKEHGDTQAGQQAKVLLSALRPLEAD
jgi:hypothetical protein